MHGVSAMCTLGLGAGNVQSRRDAISSTSTVQRGRWLSGEFRSMDLLLVSGSTAPAEKEFGRPFNTLQLRFRCRINVSDVFRALYLPIGIKSHRNVR